MNTDSSLFIGLMSGTSIDGIDAALVEINNNTIKLHHHHAIDFPQNTATDILALCQSGPNEIIRAGELDRKLGRLYATAVNQLLDKAHLKASDICAIGSHGQTIRHITPRESDHPFSLQIGDPNTIAEQTGITTIADFRRRDIAAGGEGAPLVPAFHQAAFSSKHETRVILNIGGMANISILNETGSYSGFDTGPGNVLLDAWVQEHKQLPYDKNGEWSIQGKCHQRLLSLLLSHEFFTLPPPKSTGRESFHIEWLKQQLDRLPDAISAQDVQATLVELTSSSIIHAIHDHAPTASKIYVCGGGAYNKHLMNSLSEKTPNSLDTTAALNIAPQWVEASAFAWLASQTARGLPGNSPSTTGASRRVILGAIYPA